MTAAVKPISLRSYSGSYLPSLETETKELKDRLRSPRSSIPSTPVPSTPDREIRDIFSSNSLQKRAIEVLESYTTPEERLAYVREVFEKSVDGRLSQISNPTPIICGSSDREQKAAEVLKNALTLLTNPKPSAGDGYKAGEAIRQARELLLGIVKA